MLYFLLVIAVHLIVETVFLELGTFKKIFGTWNFLKIRSYWRDMMVAGNKYSPKKVVGYIA